MAKIESIRPGGTLEASLSTYPLAELLLGILRGNLTGRLELFLHPEPRNLVVFKDGVPVSVLLPDGGVSLVKILIDSGELPHDRGLDLLRVRLQQQMRHAGVAKNLADAQAKLARAAHDDMVSISRRLRGDLNFFSLGWLNDAAGAAQEPGKYIVMADQ